MIRNGGGQRAEKAVRGRTEPERVIDIKDETEKLSENNLQKENPEEEATETAPHYPINKSALKANLAPGDPAMSSPKRPTPQKKKRKPTSATPASSPLPPTPSIPSSSNTRNP